MKLIKSLVDTIKFTYNKYELIGLFLLTIVGVVLFLNACEKPESTKQTTGKSTLEIRTATANISH